MKNFGSWQKILGTLKIALGLVIGRNTFSTKIETLVIVVIVPKYISIHIRCQSPKYENGL